MQHAFEEEVSSLGGTTITRDAGLDLEKQVTEVEEFIAQNVDAIAGYPIVLSALSSSLAKAEAAGIPVIAVDTPPNLSSGPAPGLVTDIGQAFDYAAYTTVKEMANLHPGGTFALMGLALPVESLEYLVERMKYWGEKLGLEFVGEADAQSTLINQNPELEILLTYNDESSLAAAATARAQGKSELAIGNPNSGQTIAEEGIKNGQLAVVYPTPWEKIGRQMAIATYDSLTEQSLPLPKVVNVISQVVTEENVESAEFTE
jgi:ribose transport system substrate-binding protein